MTNCMKCQRAHFEFAPNPKNSGWFCCHGHSLDTEDCIDFLEDR